MTRVTKIARKVAKCHLSGNLAGEFVLLGSKAASRFSDNDMHARVITKGVMDIAPIWKIGSHDSG